MNLKKKFNFDQNFFFQSKMKIKQNEIFFFFFCWFGSNLLFDSISTLIHHNSILFLQMQNWISTNVFGKFYSKINLIKSNFELAAKVANRMYVCVGVQKKILTRVNLIYIFLGAKNMLQLNLVDLRRRRKNCSGKY